MNRLVVVHEALAAARSHPDPEPKAAVLAMLAPQLQRPDRVVVVGEALAAAQEVDDPEPRGRLLTALVERAQADTLPWDPHWRSLLAEAADRGRHILLADLAAIGSVILRAGGQEAVDESVRAIVDVQRWWP